MTITNRSMLMAAAILASGLGLLPQCAFAQYSDTDAGEISARGGMTTGSGGSGVGVQGAVGGSTGVAFSRYALALFDVAFLPLGQNTIQGWPARQSVSRSYAMDFGLDFHIRFRLKERVSPYAIAGAGVLWNMVRQQTVDASGGPLIRAYDQVNGAAHTGGGVRYYVGHNWGIRPEVKVIISKQTYMCITVGVFYSVSTD